MRDGARQASADLVLGRKPSADAATAGAAGGMGGVAGRASESC